MKTCAYCGRKNEDEATTCQECGTDLAPASASAEPEVKDPAQEETFENIAVLDNEVQAELMDAILSGRNIPHIMQSYYDSALDGLYQSAKGWGVIHAPASFRDEILAALADVKRQSQSEPDDAESNNA
jgi:hypothetical protein